VAVTSFSASQVRALRQLADLWGADRFVLIGASALGCFLEMRWRQTGDLDLTVAASLEEYLGALLPPGWTRDPRMEQRWSTPEGDLVDIIPAGPELLRQGEVTWPRTGHRMTLLGLGLAFDHAKRIAVFEQFTLRVAPIPVLAILKIVAYQDRPQERERDLADLAYILTDFEPDDRFSDEVVDLGLTYEEAGPFLLAKEIATIAGPAEAGRVSQFVAASLDEEGPEALLPKLISVGPSSWRADPEELIRCLEAFRRGLAVPAGRQQGAGTEQKTPE
jgi:predicted nucleotidyltransferase